MVAGDWGSLDDHDCGHSGSSLLPAAVGWTVGRNAANQPRRGIPAFTFIQIRRKVLGNGMISRRDIKRVCAQIAREFRPQRIILFGSYAYGEPTPDSDVDLLVVMPLEGRAMDKAVEISRRLEHRFPIDLLVRSPEELRQRLAWNDFFLREATEKGVVMYDAADATKADARQAMKDCRTVRREARISLGLPV
mgnify:CR=1 FL=1